MKQSLNLCPRLSHWQVEYFLPCQEQENVTIISNCSHRWWWACESWKDPGRKEFLPSSSHQTAATPHGEPQRCSGCENTKSWFPWVVRSFIVKGVEWLIRIRVLRGAEIPSIPRSSGLRCWWANCDLLSGRKSASPSSYHIPYGEGFSSARLPWWLRW